MVVNMNCLTFILKFNLLDFFDNFITVLLYFMEFILLVFVKNPTILNLSLRIDYL